MELLEPGQILKAPEQGTFIRYCKYERNLSFLQPWKISDKLLQVGTVKIAFSYNASRRHITERYLSDTLASESVIHFDLDLYRPNISALKLLETLGSRTQYPDAFVHLVHTPGLPHDLTVAPIPTVALDIDSFGWTASRIRWSMLFDYVFVWHLSLVPVYQAAGHPKVFALPHAVDANLFGRDYDALRTLDIGWIGEFGYGHYARRRRIVDMLASRFKMNDFRKRYTKEETAKIYRQSKIVVNVSRDDFPPEANMRCYEAMAGGALLITGMPTELTEWGFTEGMHFIGWRTEAEIPDLVDYYLHHEKEATEIARTGQTMTLSNFTFQRCMQKIMEVLQEHPRQFFSPARTWPAEKVHLTYLEYYYRYQLLDATLEEFTKLRTASSRAYWAGLPMVLKATRHVLYRSLLSIPRRDRS